VIKVGFLQSTSKKCPTSLSINLEVVLGGLQSTANARARFSKKTLASSDSIFAGQLVF